MCTPNQKVSFMKLEKFRALIERINLHASEWVSHATIESLGDDPLHQALSQGIKGAAREAVKLAFKKAGTADATIELLKSECLLDDNKNTDDLETAVEVTIQTLVNQANFIISPLSLMKLDEIERLLGIYGLRLKELYWKWGTHETGMTHVKFAILNYEDKRITQFSVVVDRTPHRNCGPNVGFRRGYNPHSHLVDAAHDALQNIASQRKSKC